MSYTAHSASRLIRHKFGGESYPPPTTLYVGALIGAAGFSSGGTEPSGGGYARVAIANTLGNWPASSAGIKTHAIDILFPKATAAWGSVVQVGIFDAPSGGQLLRYATLPSPRPVSAGMAMLLTPGTLSFDFETAAAGTLSTLVRDELNDHILGGVASQIVGTLYLGYATTNSTLLAAGTEPSTGGYARASLAANRTNLPETIAGTLATGIAVAWPQATANQGTATNIVLFDAATSGNYLGWAVPTQSLVVNTATIPEVGAGGLTIAIAA